MQSLAMRCHTRTSRKTLTPSPAEPHSMTSTTKPPAWTLSHDSAIYLILSHSAVSYMMSAVNISGADFNVYNGLGLKFKKKNYIFMIFPRKSHYPKSTFECKQSDSELGLKPIATTTLMPGNSITRGVQRRPLGSQETAHGG